jgi:hypothetical protein
MAAASLTPVLVTELLIEIHPNELKRGTQTLAAPESL